MSKSDAEHTLFDILRHVVIDVTRSSWNAFFRLPIPKQASKLVVPMQCTIRFKMDQSESNHGDCHVNFLLLDTFGDNQNTPNRERARRRTLLLSTTPLDDPSAYYAIYSILLSRNLILIARISWNIIINISHKLTHNTKGVHPCIIHPCIPLVRSY